jgi:hypothetical protein
MQVDMESDTFDEDPNQELSVILAGLSRKIALSDSVHTLKSAEGRLIDSTGNEVGKWKVSTVEKEMS